MVNYYTARKIVKVNKTSLFYINLNFKRYDAIIKTIMFRFILYRLIINRAYVLLSDT